jgi:hypothetical protein
MTGYKFEPWRGKLQYLLSGIGLGFFFALMFAHNFVSDDQIVIVVLAFSMLGGFLLLGLGFILNKKHRVISEYEPVERSKDLDNFAIGDKETDKNFLQSLAAFFNRQLVESITFRYYSPLFTKAMREAVLQEMRKREMTSLSIASEYHNKTYRRGGQNSGCPACNADFVYKSDAGVVSFCHVCGYDKTIDDPRIFLNRLRYPFGLRNYIPLEQKGVIDLYEKNTNAGTRNH